MFFLKKNELIIEEDDFGGVFDSFLLSKLLFRELKLDAVSNFAQNIELFLAAAENQLLHMHRTRRQQHLVHLKISA